MTRIAMVSLQPHVYAGRRFKTGGEFEARGASDARLLIALKRADFAPPLAAVEADPPVGDPHQVGDAPAQDEVPAGPTDVSDADTQRKVEPEPQPEPSDAEHGAAKPRRAYRRRDMTAEGAAD